MARPLSSVQRNIASLPILSDGPAAEQVLLGCQLLAHELDANKVIQRRIARFLVACCKLVSQLGPRQFPQAHARTGQPADSGRSLLHAIKRNSTHPGLSDRLDCGVVCLLRSLCLWPTRTAESIATLGVVLWLGRKRLLPKQVPLIPCC